MDETRSIGRRSLLISSKRMTEVPYAQANQRTDRRRERERGNMRLSLCRRNRLNRNSRTRRIMLREREKNDRCLDSFSSPLNHMHKSHICVIRMIMCTSLGRWQKKQIDPRTTIETKRGGQVQQERVEEREYDDVYMSSFPITVSMNLCMP